MALLQDDKAIFYHPLDDSTETLKSQAWAGSPVFVVGKEGSAVAGTVTQAVGSETVHSGTNNRFNWVAALDSGKFMVVWIGTGNVDVFARVGTVSGTAITFGAQVTYETTVTAVGSLVGIAVFSPTKVVLTYAFGPGGSRVLYARAATVSGTTITVADIGDRAVVSAADVSDQGEPSCSPLDASRFVVAYARADVVGRARVGTVSGTDITFGAEVTYDSSVRQSGQLSTLSPTKFVVSYEKSSVEGRTRIGSVSGTTITFPSASALHRSAVGGRVKQNYAAALTSTKFVVVYHKTASDVAAAVVGVVSGTDVTFGAETTLGTLGSSGDFRAIHAISDSRLWTVYTDGSGDAQCAMIEVSGTTVAFGSPTSFQAGGFAERFALLGVTVLDGSVGVGAFKDIASSEGKTIAVSLVAADSLTGTGAAYDSVTGATKVAFAGWLKKPSA